MSTIIFAQKNKRSAQSKMRRLVGNSEYGTIGFANFQLIKDFSRFVTKEELEENPYCTCYYEENNLYDWAIQASSSYHSELTIEQMYKTNGKKF